MRDITWKKQMIKKLRKKFIVIAMCSVTAVLVLTIGGINLFNYIKLNENSDRIISIIADNGGVFPFDRKPEQGFLSHRYNGITGETPFEVRYFTAKIDENGNVSELNMQKIASVSPEKAASYAIEIYNGKKTKGLTDGYKYLKSEKDGEVFLIFLDCQKDLFTLNTFLLLSVILGVSGLIAVLLLILFLSKIALKPAEESYLKQKAFITNAGHDLKTPLTVINAEADVLELDMGKTESTQEIKKQVSVLDSLIRKLVFLAKMEEVENYELNEFNLSDLLTDVLAGYGGVFESRGFIFSADLQPGIKIKGNEELLSRAFGLLLDNALKYADEGGNVGVSLFRVAKSVKIVFYNDAKGVPPGKHDELFERFYRGDTARKTDGNGIGLSVVKAITEVNKGKVFAEADGKGIKFTIVL